MEENKDRKALISQTLKEKGIYVVKVKGLSMSPMLIGGRDSAIITSISDKPDKYDVILFEYKSELVLHRIIELTEKGYITKGDHNSQVEEIKQGDAIGILSGFIRNGKSVSVSDNKYKKYSKLIVDHYGLMRQILRLKEKFLRSVQ